MKLKEQDKNKLIMQAKRLHRYSEMLMQQCDSWLEESNIKKEKKKRPGKH